MTDSWNELPRDALLKALQDWASIYGRKLKEGALQRWIELFSETDVRVLSVALDRVTRDAERFPTPGMLTKAINAVWDSPPPGVGRPLRYSYDPSCQSCKGTGWELVPVNNMPPYKQCVPCHCRTEEKEYQGPRSKPSVGMDPETNEPVNIMVDALTGEHMYRATDCPEGRGFIAKMREMGIGAKR